MIGNVVKYRNETLKVRKISSRSAQKKFHVSFETHKNIMQKLK